MTGLRPQSDDLCDLVDLLFDEQLDAAGTDRLSRMLAGNQEALRLYVSELTLRANLAWDWGMRGAGQGDWQPGMDAPPAAGARHDGEDAEGPAAWDGLPAAAAHPHGVLPLHPLSFLVQPLTALAGNVVFSYALCALLLGGGVVGALVWRSPKERPLARESAERGPNIDAPRPGPVGRVTKAINCRWANPASGPQDAARSKIDLADGMFEITYESGATVTTLGGRVTLIVDSADSVTVSRGMVVVMTPPVSGRVTTCLGPHGGPCLVASLPISGANAGARQKSAAGGNASPPAAATRSFRIRTPSGILSGYGGAVFRVSVGNATTMFAHVFSGRVDFQAPPYGKGPAPVVPLWPGGFVYTDRSPHGNPLLLFGTDKDMPAVLAGRLPKGNFPIYSRDTRDKATAPVPGS